MNITSAGIGSGLDLEGIIEAYINAEAIPTELRLQKKQDRLTTELSGVGSFKSALSTFETTLKKLEDLEDFNKQVIDVSTSDIDVTTNGFASNGSFSIEVTQLAYGTQLQSQSFTSSSDTVGSGTLTLANGTDTFDVIIDATDTLSDIRDKVNQASDNFGIVANIINTDAGTYLTYTSEVTGAANALTVTTSDASLDNISTNNTTNQVAQDATIKIDGNTVTSSSNEFKNSIEDVTITAKVENIGNPTTLTISQDEENGDKLVKDFVNSYNALISTLDDLSNAESGALAFDPNIRSIKSQLVNIVTGSVSGLSGSFDSLDDIGITLDRYGKLEVSAVSIGTLPSGTEALADALENNLNDVGELFASTDGVTSQLMTLIDSYIGSNGTLTERNSALSVELKGIDDEYAALEAKLRDYEETLRSRFSFLDSTVAYYNATSDWLTSALALPSSSKN
ncbi:flagellar filament capping protein FliD [Thalassotalea fusca]